MLQSASRAGAIEPPAFCDPQLATLVDAVPRGSGWLHETKYDGVRLLVSTGGGRAIAWTRNGKDWSHRFPGIIRAAARLPDGCLVDGEAVALDRNGRPSFQLLQKGGDGHIVFCAFDLLVDRGEDVRRLPNIERKEQLARLLEGVGKPIIYSDHLVGRGEELLDKVCAQGGEGIVSKLASAPYRSGRHRSWLKVKCIQRQEFIIVGWQESDRKRGLRSLLLAVYEGEDLSFVGKVGTGFGAAEIQDLLERMAPLMMDQPPLRVPVGAARRVHWVRPELVAEVAFTEFTNLGILRHPRYVGLRQDKPARQIVREIPQRLQPQ